MRTALVFLLALGLAVGIGPLPEALEEETSDLAAEIAATENDLDPQYTGY